MIHYHGIAGGGTIDDSIRFIHGKHAFISYAKPTLTNTVASVCSTFALDSGAYSAWTRGLKLDYAGFVEYVEKWHRHPAFDWAVIPDVIDGTEDDNDKWLAEWPKNLPGAPVWHLHESTDRLRRLCANYDRVCLGSSGEYSTPGSEGWWRRIEQGMAQICDKSGRPTCKLHGLRMLDHRIFTKLPLASADSTNAEINGLYETRFGMYQPPTRGQRSAVLAWTIEQYQSAPSWVPNPQMELELI